ncbi:hypothetical protein H0H87_007098 [Tephrocybe sp. NHM501043]|nr:hypothetical protein H0H87_007098 [Tephrocybe sp. NHM501043]
MTSLSDQIDRLTRNARAIKSTTAHAAASIDGPFTRAILSASLGDLIRDVDTSELGLFSLPDSQITRAEFTGATPLKKAPPRRDDLPKKKDYEPETQAMEEPPLKSLIDEEEERVRSLQARFNALQERKKNAMTSRSRQKVKSTLPRPETCTKPPPPSAPLEDSFWNTPTVSARTLRFTDNIMDTESLLNEEDELGDISSASFTSPMPPLRNTRLSSLVSSDESLRFCPTLPTSPHEDTHDEKGDDADAGEDDIIVVLKKPNQESETPEQVSSSSTHGLDPASAPDTASTKWFKLTINSDVERFTARIWATIGDMIMPGHSFDKSQSGTGNKPPRAKETIAHLQSLSTLSPSPTSPSVSSVSSASAAHPAPPTSQQILTAHMLLALLMNPPQYSLPLNKVKELMAAKASIAGSTMATGTTRIIYTCVAKRLVKIDRSGGEQILKFDV